MPVTRFDEGWIDPLERRIPSASAAVSAIWFASEREDARPAEIPRGSADPAEGHRRSSSAVRLIRVELERGRFERSGGEARSSGCEDGGAGTCAAGYSAPPDRGGVGGRRTTIPTNRRPAASPPPTPERPAREPEARRRLLRCPSPFLPPAAAEAGAKFRSGRSGPSRGRRRPGTPGEATPPRGGTPRRIAASAPAARTGKKAQCRRGCGPPNGSDRVYPQAPRLQCRRSPSAE
jgi:hypothetical protein